MDGSVERVREVIQGRVPDRPPLYDLLRNDAVLSHFGGEELTLENAGAVVYRAYEPAIDATRPAVRAPSPEAENVLDDGRRQRQYRWTTWTEPKRYADSGEYARVKRTQLDRFDPAWTPADQAAMAQQLSRADSDRGRLGQVFYFPPAPGPGLMGIFGEVGLESFCYYLHDHPDLIDELLECNAVRAVSWARHLPPEHGIEAVFCGDDIAFHSGPLLSPAWFERHYMFRLARIIDAYHGRGIRVLFHSDGNLNPILDALVEAGIDGLNPIEVLADMDVGQIHRRHPHLFLAGGIDVSQLLPFGTPAQVREAVKRSVDQAGGRLMVGSSTELNDAVPLENFMAMRDTVLSM